MAGVPTRRSRRCHVEDKVQGKLARRSRTNCAGDSRERLAEPRASEGAGPRSCASEGGGSTSPAGPPASVLGTSTTTDTSDGFSTMLHTSTNDFWHSAGGVSVMVECQ